MPQVVANLVEVFPFRLVHDAAEFLMLRRAAGDALGGTWHAVHGRIEAAETAVQAALRELREETGLAPARFWQVDSIISYYIAATDSICFEPCFAAELPADQQVRLSDEHSAFRWVAAQDAAEQFMWPAQRRAIREIREEILRPGLAEPYLRIPIV